MICRDVMKTDIQCLKQDDSIVDAARKMLDENIGFLPVVDDDNRPLGTLTDRDIAVRVVAKDLAPSQTKIGDVMSREVVACSPDDDLRFAEDTMAKYCKSRLLVNDDDGRLVGISSLSDLSKTTGADALDTLREVSERETRT